MKELLLYMAKNLVDNPDSVSVTETEGETTVLELRVAPYRQGNPNHCQVRCPAQWPEGIGRNRRLIGIPEKEHSFSGIFFTL